MRGREQIPPPLASFDVPTGATITPFCTANAGFARPTGLAPLADGQRVREAGRRPPMEACTVNVLVAYASRHGSTAEIAERIAAGLRSEGLPCEIHAVNEVGDLTGYDAVVLGSAAYMFHWLKEATSFARKHRDALAERPVWLFSSGPLGTDLVDEDGNDIFEASRPKEFDELAGLIAPRGEQVFFGAWDPEAPAVGMAERMMRFMPAARNALPAGDFRDWAAIDAWATEIASELRTIDLSAGAPDR